MHRRHGEICGNRLTQPDLRQKPSSSCASIARLHLRRQFDIEDQKSHRTTRTKPRHCDRLKNNVGNAGLKVRRAEKCPKCNTISYTYPTTVSEHITPCTLYCNSHRHTYHLRSSHTLLPQPHALHFVQTTRTPLPSLTSPSPPPPLHLPHLTTPTP